MNSICEFMWSEFFYCAILEMSTILIDEISSFIEQNTPEQKTGRKCSKPVKHYIEQIFQVLNTGMQWRAIRNDLHHDTYRKKFKQWSDLNLFENAFKTIIPKLRQKGLLPNTETKDLIIDSSMIKNILGQDVIGRNHYDRGRFATKVTLIVTSSGIPLAMTTSAANNHDVNFVTETLDKVTIKTVGCRLLGDKGYISNPLKQELKKRKVHLITYRRQNQTPNHPFEMQILNKRVKVEHTFSWLKNNRRLRLRYEKKIKYFESFIYLGLLRIIGTRFKEQIKGIF